MTEKTGTGRGGNGREYGRERGQAGTGTRHLAGSRKHAVSPTSACPLPAPGNMLCPRRVRVPCRLQETCCVPDECPLVGEREHTTNGERERGHTTLSAPGNMLCPRRHAVSPTSACPLPAPGNMLCPRRVPRRERERGHTTLSGNGNTPPTGNGNGDTPPCRLPNGNANGNGDTPPCRLQETCCVPDDCPRRLPTDDCQETCCVPDDSPDDSRRLVSPTTRGKTDSSR